jgi:hypothetical protein
MKEENVNDRNFLARSILSQVKAKTKKNELREATFEWPKIEKSSVFLHKTRQTRKILKD